jgi:predicted permease
MKALRAWILRSAGLFSKERQEREFADEIESHLQMHTDDNLRSGMSEEQARRVAILRLGGVETTKEAYRDRNTVPFLEHLVQDVRYALRTLRQKPGFAAVALLTLALGCGATTVMFTVVNGVLLKPLSYPGSDRLVALREHTERFGDPWGFAYLSFLDCQRESHSLALAAWTYSGGTITEPGKAEYVSGGLISSELFPVLGVTLAGGRNFTAEEDRLGASPVVIISYRLWRRRFGGSAAAIGASLVLEDKPYTVVGIAPDGFEPPAGFHFSGSADVFTPIGQSPEPRMQNRGAHFIHVLGRLRPGFSLDDARTEVALLARHRAQAYPQFDEGRGIVALPLHKELVDNVRSTLWLLLGAVSLLLLIACVNVASLLLARAVSRERELAMRVALGASRGRLVRQCLTESMVLGLCGGGLGVLLAAIGIRPFVTFWPDNLPRAGEIHLDWRVLLFALGMSLLCGLIFGLAPALRAPTRELEQTLRAGGRTIARGSRRLHSGFVISQITLAVVLLASAGLLGRTLFRLSELDPGIDVHNVFAARIALSPRAVADPAHSRVAWQQFLERARGVPGVESVALADIIPMREGENAVGYSTTPVEPHANEEPVALASGVTPDYLRVMGIPLHQGRFFDERDRLGNDPVVVIDEVMAQHAFGGKDVVGRRLWGTSLAPGPVRVIGVVGHVRHWGLADDDLSRIRDQIYYPFAQVGDESLHFYSSIMSVAVRTKVAPLSVVEPLARAVQAVAGDQVLYEPRTLEELASASLAQQRFLLLLFGIFAGLALLLACIGIYGVLTYVTNQRVPEIGVRMALGASARDVMRQVLGQSLVMIGIGAGIGVVAAIAAARLLHHLVPGVRAGEPLTLTGMVVVLIVAALFASFLPARRASLVQPMMTLRQD